MQEQEIISYNILIVVNFFLLILIAFHIISCRLVRIKGKFKSSQMYLIKSVLYMNLPLIIGIIFIARLEDRTFIDMILMIIFGALVFNCLSYVYFHFFNMSETARRIKMLIQIYQNKEITIEELKANYSPVDQINVRLERLLAMGEIIEDESKVYHLNSKLFLSIANVFSLCRKII